MRPKQRIYVKRNEMIETFDLYVAKWDYRTNTKEFANVTWEPWAEAEEKPPTIRVEFERAQELFDALWSAGIRPSSNKAVEVTAQSKHLEDMRALAFGKLGVEKPK